MMRKLVQTLRVWRGRKGKVHFFLAWGLIFLLLAGDAKAAPNSQVVPAERLVEVAKAALLRQVSKPAQAELEPLSAPSVTVPTGRVTLVAVDPGRILPITSVRVEILVDGRQARTVYVSFRVKLFAVVVVATRPLARGQVVEKDAVRLERREVTTVTGTYLTDVHDAIGKRVEQSIGGGSLLTAEVLSAPLAVERGKPVHIVVVIGQIRITALGKALEDGRIGDLVPVQVVATGKRIQAVVVAPGVVNLQSL